LHATNNKITLYTIEFCYCVAIRFTENNGCEWYDSFVT
jgi:hypothetical protein